MSKLFQKLALVQSQLKSIPETGRNSFHGYNYATAQDIINSVRPICSSHGLFISISCSDHQILKDGKAASVMVTLTVTDAETGESTSCTMPGYAEDPKSDKSLWKAITGASKYAIRSLFCLATTDDPEQEDDQVRPPSKPSTTNRPVAVNTLQSVIGTNSKPIAVTGLEPAHSQDIPAASNGSSTTTLMEQTSTEVQRVGWTNAQGRLFLQETFSKSTRKELTAVELRQFLDYLRSLPTAPARAPSVTAA